MTNDGTDRRNSQARRLSNSVKRNGLRNKGAPVVAKPISAHSHADSDDHRLFCQARAQLVRLQRQLLDLVDLMEAAGNTSCSSRCWNLWK
jgi:hypothetical protein